jgi:hypothetical protein
LAGTLWYRLKVEHVYQRRFGDSATLAEALGNSHWYIISRRPSVRIIANSVRVDDDLLTADFITRNDLDSAARIHTLGSDFSEHGPIQDFLTYEDGAYFSVRIGDQLFHGDAWALALLSFADSSIAKQEVLYVGQAFGVDGSANAWERTRRHEKLQMIYEAHINDDCEIFVAPLSLERRGFTGDDHIDDDEDGPSLDAYYKTFADYEGRILKSSVDLIEHSLIAYFAPTYNDKLTEWRVDSPTGAMQKMRSAGFRLIHVHLSGWWGIARFYSAQEPTDSRSHFISHDLPLSPGRPVLRGISAEKLSKWRMGALLAREGREIFADRSELAGVALRVFGDEAPEVRKPPGVTLPREIPQFAKAKHDAGAADEIRRAMQEARENERMAREPTRHSGQSSYDSLTGTIAVGEYLNKSDRVRIRLHDPESSTVDSTLIVGNPGAGKSNVLRLLIAEAFLANKFIVIPLDPTGNNRFFETWNGITYGDHLIATNLEQAIRNLAMARGIVEDRLNSSYRRRENSVSDILIAIDDADIVLQHDLGAILVIDLLRRGGEVGVGLLVVVSDVNALKDNLDLMYELVSCRSKLALMPEGYSFTADLTATYGKRRSETWRDGVLSFVLHRGSNGISIGLLSAVYSVEATSREARVWCEEQLAKAGITVLNWELVHENPDSLWTMDPLAAQFWALRRHQDAWALTMVISQVNGSEEEAEDINMISWAQSVINFRFTVSHDPWQLGPTTSRQGSRTLYADIDGELVAKDTSEPIINMLLDMY